jgi:hypothetical protein
VPKQGLLQIVGPSAEPVSLTEIKGYLSIPAAYTTDDAMLQGLCIAARIKAEVLTQRQIVAAQWQLSLDGFYTQNLLPRPGVMLSSLAGGLAGWADAWRVWQERGGGWGTADIATIRPPGGRLQSVQSIDYIDDNGDPQVLDPSMYQVDLYQEPGRIVPSFGNVWPTTRTQLGAVTISYTVGFPHTTFATNISAGSQTVTPASMQAIAANMVLSIDSGAAQEWVTVSSVTGTTFTATFAQAHNGSSTPVLVTAVPENVRNASKWYVALRYENRWTDAEEKTFASLCMHSWTGEY